MQTCKFLNIFFCFNKYFFTLFYKRMSQIIKNSITIEFSFLFLKPSLKVLLNRENTLNIKNIIVNLFLSIKDLIWLFFFIANSSYIATKMII